MTSALRNAREQAGIAIEDVAKKLKIRRQYLIALEENKLSEIPGDVYAQGYLKMYASYLGIDLNECRIFSSADNLSFWAPRCDSIGRYSNYKIVISLFLIGILSIFCWYSITDKVVPDGAESLVDRLSEFDIEGDTGELLIMDHNLVDRALESVKTEESK